MPMPARWASRSEKMRVPGWARARPCQIICRPSAAAPHVSNLFYAFGHQHLGLTLGPITGEAIGALVFGDRPPLDLTPFDLQRF